MKTGAKVAVGILATIGAGYLAMSGLVLGGIGLGTICQVYPVMDVDSPDNSYVAKVENSACNPRRELRTIVSIAAARKDPGRPAAVSVFIGSAASRIEAGTYTPLQLKVTWTAVDQLEIALPKGTHNENVERDVGKVRVKYIEMEGAVN